MEWKIDIKNWRNFIETSKILRAFFSSNLEIVLSKIIASGSGNHVW